MIHAELTAEGLFDSTGSLLFVGIYSGFTLSHYSDYAACDCETVSLLR